MRSTATSRRAASGGTRLPRTAGPMPASRVMVRPTSGAMIIERGRQGQATGGQGEAEGVEHGLEADGDADAGHHAQGRGDDADQGGLQHHRTEHLSAGRTHRPQQGRVPVPLGHDDREGVVDAEGGDQQGDPAEGAQERAQEAEEVAVDRLVLLVDELLAGERRRPRPRAPTDRFAASSSAETPSAASTRTLVAPSRPPRMCSRAPSRLKPVKVTVPSPSSSPKVAMPTISTSTGLGVSTVVWSPTWSSPSSAAPRLMMTSSWPSGARPSTRR